jgi:acyl-CoA oxidase
VPYDKSLEEYRSRGRSFNGWRIRTLLDSKQMDVLYAVQSLTRDPALRPSVQVGMTLDELRAYQLKVLLAFKCSGLLNKAEDDKDHSPLSVGFYALATLDMGLMTRLGVSIVLYGGTLRALGTAKHSRLIERLYSLEDYGCFCLTELGHGSNASGIETTATYVHATREIELNTPSTTASKWWVGALGKTANVAVIFAQLYVKGKHEGVHVFAINIRDYKTHADLPGVLTGDNSYKVGLDCLDQGFIHFTNYRVSYDCMLDRVAHIDESGTYQSDIPDITSRFSVAIAGLGRGRLSVVQAGEAALRNAVVSAIRYGAVRKQFGKPGKPESALLDYPLHRHRLVIPLARVFACNLSLQYAFDLFGTARTQIEQDPRSQEGATYHAVISALKPVVTWYSQEGIQECREACGAMGYSAFSMFGIWRGNNDINLTWEGDNHILTQQVARYFLKALKSPHTSLAPFLTTDFKALTAQRVTLAEPSKLADNLDLLMSLFEYRVNLLALTSTAKLQRLLKSMDYTDAWNHSQVNHFKSLGLSFGEWLMLKEFIKAVRSVSQADPNTGAILSQLCCLFGYHCVVESLALYRDYDFLSAEQSRWVRDFVQDLAYELGESAVKICDAIAWFDDVTSSVLGRGDGQVYRNMVDAVQATPWTFERPTWFSLIQQLRGG